MTTPVNPVPVVSSELINTLFGETVLTAIKNGKYRALTELISPPVQGHNAYVLAKYIIEKAYSRVYVDPVLLDRANFFIKQWDDNTCYLCGLPIKKDKKIYEKDKTQNEELEHILPIGLALGLLGIIQENKRDFDKLLRSDMIDDRTALLYLLEYARSHACCNQIKSSISFLKWNGKIYDVDHNSIRHVLRRICNSEELGLQQQTTHCANELWLDDMKSTYGETKGKIDCKNFIDESLKRIKTFYIDPIVTHLTSQFKRDQNYHLTHLVFLANQAMSVDPTLWEYLGADEWAGEVVMSKDDFFSSIKTQAMTIISGRNGKDPQYQNTTGIVLQDIFQIAERDYDFKVIFEVYRESHKQNTRPSRSGKPLDKSAITNGLKEDMAKFVRICEEFFKMRQGVAVTIDGVAVTIDGVAVTIVDKSYLYWGYLYMENLIYNQVIPLREDMIDTLAEMLVNVNNYVLFNIYLWIIWYKPFSNGDMIPAIDDKLNDALDSAYSGKDKYLGRHDTFLSKFPRFNYTVYMVDGFPYDFRILNEFINYLIRIPSEYEATQGLLELVDKYYDDVGPDLTDIQIAPGSPYTIGYLSHQTTPASTPAATPLRYHDDSPPGSPQPYGRITFKGEELFPPSAVDLSTYVGPHALGTQESDSEHEELQQRGREGEGDKRRRDRSRSREKDKKQQDGRVSLGRPRSGTPEPGPHDYGGGGKSKRSLTMPIKRSHYYGKVKRNVIRRKSRKTKNNKKTKRNKTIKK